MFIIATDYGLTLADSPRAVIDRANPQVPLDPLPRGRACLAGFGGNERLDTGNSMLDLMGDCPLPLHQ